MPTFKQLPGAHVKHHKNTADREIVSMPIPDQVVISMSQHLGSPCKPLVKPGDPVKVGQKIGDSEEFLSAPIFSSVSGTVKAIEKTVTSRGAQVDAIVIDTDKEQTVSEDVKPPVISSHEELVAAAKACGLVGLGGAGFPTHIKLNPKNLDAVDTLVINGAECEPYITSDYRQMMEKSSELLDGIALIMKHMNIAKAIIGIEDNKPDAIKKLSELAASRTEDITVTALRAVYPKGGEKVLIYETTGHVVMEGKLPADCGVLVMNVGTVIKLDDFAKTGMPLVNKVLTVDGSAVKEPKNVLAPIGTKIEDIVNFCGGYACDPSEIIMGGPMMGVSCQNDQTPIVKSNNAILAFNAEDAAMKPETACIRCGRCMRTCPVGLNPAGIDRAYHSENVDALKELKVNLCMECGCCSYVCPAKRHLVVYNQMGKKMIR